MNNDPIETEGEPVAMTKVIARRDDAPALRELVGALFWHAQHAYDCDAGRRGHGGGPPSPPSRGCTCGLDLLRLDAEHLGCRSRAPSAQPRPTEAELAAHAAAGGFLGGLAGNLINGLVHGAQARKEARDAKKTPCKPKRAAAARPADAPARPRRLGPGKGVR